jgi:hypothetical protein
MTRNAVKDYASFSADIAQLDEYVDWVLMEQQMWNNTPSEPDRMERRMAEFLVYQHVPWDAFLGVATFDKARSEQAEQILASVGCSTRVEVRRRWYF